MRKKLRIATKVSDEMRVLQLGLSRAGDLPYFLVGKRCHAMMKDALSGFQKRYGLRRSGRADDRTLELLLRPRCGVPDALSSTGSMASAVDSGGEPWVESVLKYFISRFDDDLSEGKQRDLIVAAMDAWTPYCGITFEPGTSNHHKIPISFNPNNHGDGVPFDGLSGNLVTYAHAFPKGSGIWAGSVHFNEAVLWGETAAGGAFKLKNVALHEFGHILGLPHSTDPDSLMYAAYDDTHGSITADARADVKALYGIS